MGVCHGVVYYRTSAFVTAAKRAAATLSEIPWPSSGEPFRVVWTFWPEHARADGDAWEDYEAFHGVASSAFASADVCVNLVEADVTSEPSLGPSRILGSAAECAACLADWNVALVRSGLGPELTHTVILHELGHLFCAPHLSESSEGVMSSVAGSAQVTPASAEIMSRNMDEKFRSGVCPGAGGQYPVSNVRQTSANHGHAASDHDHKHTHSHDSFDAYDSTVGIVFFSLVFFVLVVVVFWGCAAV